MNINHLILIELASSATIIAVSVLVAVFSVALSYYLYRVIIVDVRASCYNRSLITEPKEPAVY